MSSLSQVVDQMQAHGLPMLPHGHPVLDGKVKRFGPGKKSWYALREVSLKSGEVKVSGAFGVWQGTNNNATLVTMDWSGVTDEERAAAEKKQREHDAREAEKKARLVAFAANRARMQWDAAATDDVRVSPYLERKQVRAESVRITEDGTLLVPMRKYALDGTKLVGLQKIAPDGTKLFNKGMDKVGAGCLLGTLGQDTPVAIVGEGYATCASVRMAFDVPVMVAFDAGNLLAVAKVLRRDFPTVHLLFAADDDSQLESRLHERLLKEFGITGVLVDGGARSYKVADATLSVTATWRMDGNGVPFIEADVRGGRVLRTLRFENAGLASAKAAAAAVGNASVVYPQFPDLKHYQAGYCDFNDLHVNVSVDAVRLQIGEFIAVASGNPLIDASAESPAPSDLDAANGASPPAVDAEFNSPAPLGGAAAMDVVGLVQLEWALEHWALVQGTTDVWDAPNKLRMRRAAFLTAIGKDGAKAWETHALRRSISPRNLPKTVRGVAAASGGAGDDGIVMMLDRYTLLYGTKTVWDADKKTILGYDAMALARGADLASRWIAHPLHMERDLDKLVFDPTQRVDLNTHINMFEGFPLKPKKDEAKAKLALDLLWSLCSSEANGEEVYRWVLSWLAYPLQHPGAKMQTALLFFGEKQGTGKSLFFEGIVKPIYGAHGATGGQHQLESTYTMWRSQKLFVLFEEILSRQDKYSYFGLIKHMITGRDTPISQKFKDDRVEANHLNCVMLSNEFQAIPLEPEDRRFLVVDVKTLLDPDLLARVKAVLDDGLIEAFYDFLLNYPLDGFDPHTKTVMTDSKRRVIRFGLPGWDAFYQAWSGGELDAPFCSCLSSDLYLVYERWCSACGERSISLTKWAELMATRVDKSRQNIALGMKPKKTLTVFKVPTDEDVSISKLCQRFRDSADIKDKV